MELGGEGGRGRGRKRGSSTGHEEGRGRGRERRPTPQWDYKRGRGGDRGGARAVLALAVLVAASQVGSAQAYSCTSDADCQSKGCIDNSCSLCKLAGTCNCRSAGIAQQASSWLTFDCTSVKESLYQSNGKWKVICTGGVCDRWGDDFGSCSEPAPCPAGTYSGTGKNEAGVKACRPCDTGKYASNTGLSS
jgi:hypothetical protein